MWKVPMYLTMRHFLPTCMSLIIGCCFRFYFLCDSFTLYLCVWVRSQGNSTCKDVGVPSITGEDPILMVVPEKQSSAEQVAEFELNNNNPPRLGCNWNEEDIDAPTSEFRNIPMPVYIFWIHEFGNIVYTCMYFRFMFIHESL